MELTHDVPEERYLAAPADGCGARAPRDDAPCDRAADTARWRRVEEERIILLRQVSQQVRNDLMPACDAWAENGDPDEGQIDINESR